MGGVGRADSGVGRGQEGLVVKVSASMDRRTPASRTTARLVGTPQREFDDEEDELTELELTEDELELTWLPEPLEVVEVETE